MRNNKDYGATVKSHAEVEPNASEPLSQAGSLRRDFLGGFGRWGAAVIVFGLGAETAMQVLSKRSALSSALAAGPVYEDVPPPPEPTGTIHWVATDGDDANAGTEAEPFATVQKAHDSCRNADGIYVKAGYYVSGRIDWTKSGIILRGAPGTTREQVIIERAGSGRGATILIDSNPTNRGDEPIENCQIYGVTVQGGPEVPHYTDRGANWQTECLRIRGNVHNFKIINCVVRHAFNRGCLLGNNTDYSDDDFPHNIELAYNDFYQIGTDTAGADISLGPRTGFVHIHHNDLHGDVDGAVSEGNHIGSLIENNIIREHFGPRPLDEEPGRFRSSEDGVDIKKCYTRNPLLPADSRTIIRHNVIHDHPRYTGISIQTGTKNVDVYGNTIYRCGNGILVRTHSSGINSGERGSPPDYTRDVKIWDNEIYDCDLRGFSMDSYGADGVKLTSNLVYNCGNADRHAEFRGSNRYAGFYIAAGWNIELSGNVISNNGQLSAGNPQIDMTESTMSELTSNNNTFYLPDASFSVARVGGSFYGLSEWQSSFGQDGNSTERSTRYEAPATPRPPGGIEVSYKGDFEGGAQCAAEPTSGTTPASLG